MTTLLEAFPNFRSKSICRNSFLASSKSSIIKTPLPAARPSALRTYGGLLCVKKASPSCNFSAVNSSYAAVGILCLDINAFANALLPSSVAAFFCGPITPTFARAVSFRKKS